MMEVDIGFKAKSSYNDTPRVSKCDQLLLQKVFRNISSSVGGTVMEEQVPEILSDFGICVEAIKEELDSLLDSMPLKTTLIFDSEEKEFEEKETEEKEIEEAESEQETVSENPLKKESRVLSYSDLSVLISKLYRPFYIYSGELTSLAERGDTARFMYLVNHGCNPKLVDGKGMNSFHYCCQNGQLEMCQSLLEKIEGFENRQDSQGWTPLFYAAAGGHLQVMKELCSRRSVISMIQSTLTITGRNVLHIAVLKSKIQIVKYLVSEFASKLIPMGDKNGSTALHLGALTGNYDIVSILIKGGANPLQKDSCGNCAGDMLVDEELRDFLFPIAKK